MACLLGQRPSSLAPWPPLGVKDGQATCARTHFGMLRETGTSRDRSREAICNGPWSTCISDA